MKFCLEGCNCLTTLYFSENNFSDLQFYNLSLGYLKINDYPYPEVLEQFLQAATHYVNSSLENGSIEIVCLQNDKDNEANARASNNNESLNKEC